MQFFFFGDVVVAVRLHARAVPDPGARDRLRDARPGSGASGPLLGPYLVPVVLTAGGSGLVFTLGAAGVRRSPPPW